MVDQAQAETVAEELRTALGRVVRRLRRESGMPYQHATALGWLRRGGPMTASGLAAAEHITPQSMAVTLAALHEQGLVERAPDPDDRRQILWSVTPRGQKVIAEQRARRARWLVTAIEELSDEDTSRLREAAGLLNDIMDRSEANGA
ncbi:MarR family transcriptional regulator [Sphaerisporangium sp. NPDC049002]|uniref:MarR family winged helix-turn-helix transcriptional regulator n=1 Tax=unclassified Sphaerisporangium TaxID=2630420 RepID=UPI0033F54254